MSDDVEQALSVEPVMNQVPWWENPEVSPPLICHVSPFTREFMGVGVADPSPLEPSVWLFPAHSYEVPEPGSQAGKVAVISEDGKAWSYLADHRGATVYDTNTGEPHSWQSLGELPAGFTLNAPVSEFDTWQDDEWVLDEKAQSAELTKTAARKKTLLAQYSAAMISTLQNAVDLEMANAAEVEALKAWKVYGVYLNRVQPSAELKDSDWPSTPDGSLPAALMDTAE